jgi:hypothetical protein
MKKFAFTKANLSDVRMIMTIIRVLMVELLSGGDRTNSHT